MKWTYSILQKFKAAIALGVVFLIIFTTNLLDKSHFTRLQNSFTSVYDDRLMAEIYIYKISNQLRQKKNLLTEAASKSNALWNQVSAANQSLNDSLASMVEKFEQTKLTIEEANYFNQLKSQLNQLQTEEKRILEARSFANASSSQLHQNLYITLDRLTQVQLKEGKNLIDDSNRIIAASNITFRLEIAILVIVALIVQALIFSSKSTIPKINRHSSLN